MKKICFFVGDITRSGGTERITSIIANNLSNNKKYKIFILSICKKRENNFFEIDNKIKEDVLLNKHNYRGSLDYFSIVYKLRKYLKKNNIDIIIDVDVILDLFSLLATSFINTKVISWEHFNFYENLGVKSRDYARKLSSKFADAIVTITKEDLNYYKNNLNLKVPIYNIYNPIILSKQKYKYDINSKILLSVGRLTSQKGFDLLLEVAKIIFNNETDWKWLIVGEGEERENLEKKIKQYNLEKKVMLVGNKTNIDDFYNKSSIFVLTSRFEGFGLVITEAKAHHLPCVSFKCKAGPSELIEDGVNGDLIECYDIESMANRLVHLMKDEKKRDYYSKNSLTNIDEFLLTNIMDKWNLLIESL